MKKSPPILPVNPTVPWCALPDSIKTLVNLGSTRGIDQDNFLSMYGSYQFPNLDSTVDLPEKLYTQLDPKYASISFVGHSIIHCGSLIISLSNALLRVGIDLPPEEIIRRGRFNYLGLFVWDCDVFLHPRVRFRKRHRNRRDLLLSMLQFPADIYILETNRFVSQNRNFWVVPIDTIREEGSHLRVINCITGGLERITFEHVIGGVGIQIL